MDMLRVVLLATIALLGTGRASAELFTYEFDLMATTPNSQVPSQFLPFGFNTATPSTTFHATLQYEVTGNTAELIDFAATVGDQSWVETPQQTFNPTLNADGTLAALFFRADSDGDAQDSAQWQDIIGIFINFGGSTFWRAFEGNCLVGDNFVLGACIQGTEAADGISYTVTRDGTVSEPATLWLALSAFLGLMASRVRKAS